jgi:hypothetical protein
MLGWIAVLAIALLTTSLQAKLGLYHPKRSQEHLVSQAFKLSECRLERAATDPPLAAPDVAPAVCVVENPRPEAEFLEYAPPKLDLLFQSRSHWFRPPPVRS